jgi:3-phosphoshikimate 1-carboxyvinyltransferase
MYFVEHSSRMMASPWKCRTVTPMPEIRVPGDKSLTHRALMLAALADGACEIRYPLIGADTLSTAAVLRALGATVPALTADTTVQGNGLHGLRASAIPLDCGNSGTTARLMMGILAGYEFESTLTGDASLCSRPMRRVTTPLSRMGAHFTELGVPDRLPLRMRGGDLQPIDYDSPHASAQVKSAVLLAGLTAAVPVSVGEPTLSRDHTERMLARLGVPLTRDGLAVRLQPVDRIEAFSFDVPGDFSSAAFMMAVGCLVADTPLRIAGVGLNPTRTGFLAVLDRMGADIVTENVRESCGEPIGDVVVRRSSLVATRISAAEIPSLIDEVPVIAVLAARAAGTTIIEGAGELRVKESDRIAAIVANLNRIGVTAEELLDGLVVHGTPKPLGGRIATMNDHRIAMAFGLLNATEHGSIDIDDPGVVDVSYPEFWNMLTQIART